MLAKRSIPLLAGVLLAGCATVPPQEAARPATLPPQASEPATAVTAPSDAEVNATFEKIGASYIDIYTALNPVAATSLGDHAHDADLPRIDADGRKTEAIMVRELLDALGAIDRTRLTRDNQVDYAMLRNSLEYSLWDLEATEL